MFGLLLNAALLGTIVAVMEEDEFPGWWKMFGCVLAATVPAAIINVMLPPELFFVGLLIGSLCGAVAIASLCQMSFKRAFIASEIWFGITLVLQFILMYAMSK